jgi:hypothetical protein
MPSGTPRQLWELLERGLALRAVETEPKPKPDHVTVFVRVNGSSKTELCVQHPTGAVDVLSTEP